MRASTAWACKADGSSIRIYGIVRSMSRGAEVEAQALIDALNRRVASARLTASDASHAPCM